MPIKVSEGVNVHIHLRDSYRKDVKNVVINIKDKLDMVSVVEKNKCFCSSKYSRRKKLGLPDKYQLTINTIKNKHIHYIFLFLKPSIRYLFY